MRPRGQSMRGVGRAEAPVVYGRVAK
jgi:hypothetical protein